MNSKRSLLVVGAFIFLICCVMTALAVFYFQTRPPGALSDSGYYIRLIKVYYYPGFGLAEPFEIKGADVGSFEIIDETYAKDKSHVYFEGTPIPESDPVTFEIVDNYFSRDSHHVYLNGNIFSDDPVNFKPIDGNIYIDSQHIYWSTEPISDDPTNLVVIENSSFYTYLKDSRTVFVNGNPINGADPNTFEVINDGYSRDAKNAFYFNELISDADINSFEALEQQYARDANVAYWMGKPIPGSDPATFVVLNADFECTRDAQHAFYQDQQIQNFDPASFAPDATVIGCSVTELITSP